MRLISNTDTIGILSAPDHEDSAPSSTSEKEKEEETLKGNYALHAHQTKRSVSPPPTNPLPPPPPIGGRRHLRCAKWCGCLAASASRAVEGLYGIGNVGGLSPTWGRQLNRLSPA
jgi:hypothetical protein